ncbi:Alg9-like mannosyltransferase family [Zea mays]|uniref:Mannosyltransferase n=1 Tax=Zea mays TaxID=4577 RepID=A0A1D6GYE1_MAIZE|nr:Alg9-like mannosyltransferase family [Zea mays]
MAGVEYQTATVGKPVPMWRRRRPRKPSRASMGVMMSHRRRSRAAGSPPSDASTGTAPTPEKSGWIRPWAATGSDLKVLELALAFRAANALLVRTYFNPDEHWQCLEVAHRVAFGYGHLTWEWKRGLRSYLHPLIFAALYKTLALLHLDTPWVMVMAPRLVQSLFAAFGDLYLYKLSKLIFNGQVAKWTMKSKCCFILLDVIPVGAIVLAVTTLLDWWMYGSWVIVPLNFLKFNLLSSGGDYYGTHVFHWYFTQGFPSMIWTFLPFALCGIVKSQEWRLSGLIAWVLGVYSILGHKEFRFVLPVLPLALMFSGYCLASMSRSKGKNQHRKDSLSRMQPFVILLVITNVPMALYMSLFHQVGFPYFIIFMRRFFHSHFKVDRDLQSAVVVYSRRNVL